MDRNRFQRCGLIIVLLVVVVIAVVVVAVDVVEAAEIRGRVFTCWRSFRRRMLSNSCRLTRSDGDDSLGYLLLSVTLRNPPPGARTTTGGSPEKTGQIFVFFLGSRFGQLLLVASSRCIFLLFRPRCRKAAASKAVAALIGRIPAALANVAAVAAATSGLPTHVMCKPISFELSFAQPLAFLLRQLSLDQPLNGRDPRAVATPVKAGRKTCRRLPVQQLFCIAFIVRILGGVVIVVVVVVVVGVF